MHHENGYCLLQILLIYCRRKLFLPEKRFSFYDGVSSIDIETI